MKAYIVKEILPHSYDRLYVVIARDASDAKAKINNVFHDISGKLRVVDSLTKGVQYCGLVKKS